ncbi:hypothetical protein EVAR_67076_1 [Eumeta japonica]|uniref:Uncharacterized protein n=1 Tax=Eumeta variegata TaxID=151549 RepID=A0A4C2A7T3_EUMVA|nr:hypothetical protein EVAR_67076_1 [Eumeta japonica]
MCSNVSFAFYGGLTDLRTKKKSLRPQHSRYKASNSRAGGPFASRAGQLGGSTWSGAFDVAVQPAVFPTYASFMCRQSLRFRVCVASLPASW